MPLGLLAALTLLLCAGIAITTYTLLRHFSQRAIDRVRALRRLRQLEAQATTSENLLYKMLDGTPGVDVPPRRPKAWHSLVLGPNEMHATKPADLGDSIRPL